MQTATLNLQSDKVSTNSDVKLLSRSQGCLLGQLAGDALGELVEFRSRASIAQAYPDGVRDLVDGGTWDTIAGQPTDDSELALLLARDLVKQGRFDAESVARAYAYWYSSGPFDCGNTTRTALAPASSALRHGGSAAVAARDSANVESQANGALMRISPLGIFGHSATPEQLAQWAREDAKLTHPHPICQDASVIFVVTIRRALLSGGAPAEIYHYACKWAADNNLDVKVVRTLIDAEAERPNCEVNQGWVLIALQNAFWQLVNAESLEAGIIDTVMQGGDTDTNSAIAGALLGAVYGLESIPQRWQDRVLSCRPIEGLPGVKRPRPACFWPVDALVLSEQLLGGHPRND